MNGNEVTVLDKNSPVPLYFQLEKWLLEEIEKETYPIGKCIPTENQLKERFQISRTTVRQAINDLIQEGWLYRNGTKGTVVTKPQRESASVRSMEPFNKQIVRAGQTPRTEVMELKIITADEVLASYLNINVNVKVISMFRRRFADDLPIATLQNYLRYDRCSFMLDHDFTTESLYEVLSEREETKTCGVKQVVEAQTPTKEDISLFEINITTPILGFRCWDRNSKDEVISYNLLRYRGDCMKFEVDMVKGTSDRSFNLK